MTEYIPGQLGARFRASARLLDDGHVEFTHECNGQPVVATLPMPPWRVVQSEPLTVEPSLHCTRCGWHGWIDDGEAGPGPSVGSGGSQ